MFSTTESLNPWITSIFCDLSSAAGAVRALKVNGFHDEDIELIGVLSGRAPDLETVLLQMGLPARHSEYCNACFEHGAVLLSVRTLPSDRRKVALKLLRQYGGNFPD
jgi:hypothetical protein